MLMGKKFRIFTFSVSAHGTIFVINSVKFVEGTVTSLEEEDGCVTGIQYREKDTGMIKVMAH